MGGRYIGYTSFDETGAADSIKDARTLNVGDVVFMTMFDRAQPLDDHDVIDGYVFSATLTNVEQTGFQRSGAYTREDWRFDFGDITSIYITVTDGEFKDRIPAVFRTYEAAAKFILESYEESLNDLTEEFEAWEKKLAHRKATLTRPIELREPEPD